MSRISTRDLNSLPSVERLKALLQSLALLDAIMSPEWQYRYYSFNSEWASGEQMGSMRDGCGDSFFALFNEFGCFLKGFAHESTMSPFRVSPPEIWPGVLDEVPEAFGDCLSEPAFSMDETTFCIWCMNEDVKWSRGPVDFPSSDDPDGSEELLSVLDGNQENYACWATDYYETDVPLNAVRSIYDHGSLTPEIVRSLNTEVDIAELRNDAIEIGYQAINL